MDIKLLLYYLSIAAGGVLSAISGYRLGKKGGLPVKPLRVFIALALFFGFSGALLMGQLQNFIMSLTGLEYSVSRMRIFGGLLFTPLFMYLPVKYLTGDFRFICDMRAPGAYLILGCSKIGCAIYGCCYGIRWDYGVATPFESHRCFPVQLLEALLCFLLFCVIYLLYIRGHIKKGTVYPVGLVLYGVVRFLAEYLRFYPEVHRTFFFGMNFWQMISVITLISGIVWLIISSSECRKNVMT